METLSPPQSSTPDKRDFLPTQPENDFSPERWPHVHLDHFLVVHTNEHVSAIAEAVNRQQYEAIYVEFVGESDERTYFERIAQRLLDNDISLDDLPPEIQDEFIFKLADKLSQQDADFVLVDAESSNLREIKEQTGVRYDQSQGRFEALKKFAEENKRRDELVYGQLVKNLGFRTMLYSNGKLPNIKTALVTGAIHTYPSAQLSRLGVTVKREFIGNRDGLDFASHDDSQERVRFTKQAAAERMLRYGKDEKEAKNLSDRALIEERLGRIILDSLHKSYNPAELASRVNNLSDDDVTELIRQNDILVENQNAS